MARINADLLKAINSDAEMEVEMLPGTSMGAAGLSVDNPKVREIAKFLYENPMYVTPIHNLIQKKQAAVAAATLRELYTPEELAEMMERQGISAADQKRVTG